MVLKIYFKKYVTFVCRILHYTNTVTQHYYRLSFTINHKIEAYLKYSIFITHDNAIWYCTKNGIFKVQENMKTYIPLSFDTNNEWNYVSQVFRNHQLNIWGIFDLRIYINPLYYYILTHINLQKRKSPFESYINI